MPPAEKGSESVAALGNSPIFPPKSRYKTIFDGNGIAVSSTTEESDIIVKKEKINMLAPITVHVRRNADQRIGKTRQRILGFLTAVGTGEENNARE